jgi:hypothetical protein
VVSNNNFHRRVDVVCDPFSGKCRPENGRRRTECWGGCNWTQ